MRILITNDDGIGAEGLKVLEKIAQAITDDVWMVAPETNQSGSSHSLTLQVPLRFRQVGDRAFAVRGTPADCVIMGVRHVMKDEAPTLILSGVNHGANLAEDVSYSGTIAGAMQGTHLRIRSIALSLTYGVQESGHPQWATALEHGPGLIRSLLETDWAPGVLMNVNFPDAAPDEVTGVCVTKQGERDQGGLHLQERADTWGDPYFWIGFAHRRQMLKDGTDLAAIANKQISVTPLALNLTDHQSLDSLQQHLNTKPASRVATSKG
jgi:5'/3'-nucleotidase